jgi:uncharacterized repeat protein (TIGR01451 family)
MKNTAELQTHIVHTHPRSHLACIKQAVIKAVAAFSLMGIVLTGVIFPANQALAATPAPDLVFSSLDDLTDPVAAGVDFSYEARISNTGDLDAANATLTFTLGAGLEYRGYTSVSPAIMTCSASGVIATGQTVSCNLGAIADFATQENVLRVQVRYTLPGGAGTQVISTAVASTAGEPVIALGDNNKTVQTAITEGADLQVLPIAAPVNTSPPNDVYATQPYTYTISSRNNGPNATTNTTISYPLGANLTYISTAGTGAGWICNQVAGTVTCSYAASIANGGSYPDIKVNVRPTVVGTITNSLSISSSSQTDGTPANNTQTKSVTVGPGADVQVTSKTKTAPASVFLGDTVSYSVVVKNNGPSTVDFTMEDSLPVSLTYQAASVAVAGGTGSCTYTAPKISCDFINMVSGASRTITYNAVVNAIGSISNTAAITTTSLPDGDPSNNAKTATFIATNAVSDLNLTKTISKSPVANGEAFSWTITPRNTGPSPLVLTAGNTVTIEDALPAAATYVSATGTGWLCNYDVGTHKVTCTLSNAVTYSANSNLPAITINAIASVAGPAGTTASLSNTVCSLNTHTPAATNATDCTNTNSGGHIVTADEIDLDITKKQQSPSNPVAGIAPITVLVADNTLTYTLDVTNLTAGAVAKNVRISDTIPSSLYFSRTSPTVATGVSATWTNSSGTSGNCTFSTATRLITCDVGDMPASGTATATIVLTRPFKDDVHSNTASVVSLGTGETVTGNNTSNTVVTTVEKVADLTISKTDTPDPVQAGTTLTYVLTATNIGASAVPFIQATDVLDSQLDLTSVTLTPASGSAAISGSTITWNGFALASGAATTLTITARPKSIPLPLPASMTNTFSIAAYSDAIYTTSVPESDLGNNSGSIPTALNPAKIDLQVVKVDEYATLDFDPQGYDALETSHNVIAYKITASNNTGTGGGSYATNVKITDTQGVDATSGHVLTYACDMASLPSAEPASGAYNICAVATSVCTVAGATVECPLGDLAAGTSALRYIVYSVPTSPNSFTPYKDIYSSSVAVTSDEVVADSSIEVSPSNNNEGETTTVVLRTDLGITKVARPDTTSAVPAQPATFDFRQPFYFDLTVSNYGPATSHQRTITDNVPAGLTVLSAVVVAPAIGSCTITGQLVSCDITSDLNVVPLSESAETVRIQVRNDIYQASFSNTTNVIAPLEIDKVQSNNTYTQTVNIRKSSVEGYVFDDRTANGLRDGSDPGITGVTLTLTAAAGVDAYNNTFVSRTQLTNGSGFYKFDTLPPGTYTVTEQAQTIAPLTGYFDGAVLKGQVNSVSCAACTVVSISPNNIGNIVLPVDVGHAATVMDFGEIKKARLAGRVFIDSNLNAIKDSTETIGLNGVQITLTGTDDLGPVSATSASTASGAYTFNDLRPGTYSINQAPVAGLVHTGMTIGSVGGNDGATTLVANTPVVGASKRDITQVLLKSGDVAINYNFGEYGNNQALSGYVYVDLNTNGIKDTSELPIQGVMVKLSGTTVGGQDVCAVIFPDPCSTTTDVNGLYSFGNLPEGIYTLTEFASLPLNNYGDGSDGASPTVAGSLGGTRGNDVLSAINLIAGSAGQDYNFGELPGSLSGTVYFDNNHNGAKDTGEIGIANVTVNLTGYSWGDNNVDNNGAGDDVAVAAASTISDSNGAYSFSGLLRGTYVLTETHPAIYLDGKETRGTIDAAAVGSTDTGNYDATPVNNKITGITLAAGRSGIDYLFGERAAGLSGFVYVDANDNGLKDVSEPGIVNVTLTLTGDDSSSTAVTRTATTDSTGFFNFGLLPASDGTGYTITETHPAGYLDGKETRGTIDSVAIGSFDTGSYDALSSNNKITGIVMNAGKSGINYLFGERGGALTGYVYFDADKDGDKAGVTELGIPNIPVTLSGLTTGNVDICTLINCIINTDATGKYSFDGVPPGTYKLVENHSAVTAIVDAGGQPKYSDGKEKAGVAGGVVNNAYFGGQAAYNTIDNIIVTATNIAANSGVLGGYLFGEVLRTDNTGLTLKPPIISGHVYMDRKHTRVRPTDGSMEGQHGWSVVLTQNGATICTVMTDNAGFYQFDNLHCPGYEVSGLPAGTGFAINFSHNNNRLPNVAQSGGDAGLVSASSISNITLLASDEKTEQNLPLDPSGVVYDAVTRAPVAGAVVTIAGPAGFDAATHLLGGVPAQTQTTGADGLYQFFLQNAFPVGTYTLTVTTYPVGYIAAPSELIPVCTAGTGGVPLTVGAIPTPGLVQTSNNAPSIAAPLHNPTACAGMVAGGVPTTQYYMSFVITGASAPILNNHIPLDPFQPTDIRVTKTTPLINISRGDLVPYTITATNTLSVTLNNIDIRDQVPPGFKYKHGTASVDGVAKEPTVNGRNLNWANLTFTAKQKHVIRLMLVAGSGVAEGEYVNRAFALNNVANAQVSNTATATVRVVPDPTFDCSDLIGKVFDDKNANGYQDDGEPGIANVRLATVNGLLVTTDDQGRFHITCAEVPNELHGSNFVMKLDERTLPSGYRVTTENPRDVRMTRGKMSKLNFGAAIHRVFRVELSNDAFKVNESVMTDSLAKAVTALPEKLRGQVSVVRLAYDASGEDEKLVRSRLKQVRTTLEKLWKKSGCCYALSFEEEVFERKANRQGGVK